MGFLAPLLAPLLMTLVAHADPSGALETYPEATLKLCQDVARAHRNGHPVLMGCADRVILTAGGKSHLLDFATSLSVSARTAVKHRLAELRDDVRMVEVSATVEGYQTREDGHFPNPMATFDVFRVTSFTPK